MTSRKYDDYCRVNALLKNMREQDLRVLSYAVIHTLNEENNLYYIDSLRRLAQEIDLSIKSCVVD